MKKSLVVGILAVGLLAGCASSGSKALRDHSEQTVATHIIEGETTKREVLQVFGSPMNTTFTDGGREIWEYSFADMSADAVTYIPIVNWLGTSSSGTQKKLTILFDDDVVSRYSMTESDVRTGTGLFR